MKSVKISVILVLILYIITLTTIYILQEHNIYYWDYKSYWILWQNLSDNIFISPCLALKQVFHSISYDDYNLSPVLMLAIFKLLPIPSRLSYVIGINLFYLVPVSLIFTSLQNKIYNLKNINLQILSYILVITFTPFWAPSLRGYPDICGLFFLILAIYFCVDNNLINKLDIKNSIKLGICLWLAFLLRRWYAYTIVSLYLTLPMLNFYLYKESSKIKELKNVISNFFIAGTISVILSCLFQWHLVKRIFQTNYSYIYSAYQTSISYSIYFEIITVGFLFFLFTCLFSFIILFKGKKKSKIIVIFSWSNLILSFTLFTHTQSPGIHHSIPFEFWLLLLFSQGIFYIFDVIKNKNISVWLMVILSIILVTIHLNSLFGIYQNKYVEKFLPNMNLPLRVSNYSEYIRLANDLEKLTMNNEKISIFSSNSNLNEDTISNLTNYKIDRNLTYVAQVDLRDGFRPNAIMSKYVVITNPIQLHLNPDGQRVITVPVLDIIKKRNIGHAYTKIGGEYKLNGSVKASIYKKNRSFTTNEVNEFLSELYQYYPEWKKIYTSHKLILSFLNSQVTLGDMWGVFELQEDGSILTHPGKTLPTIIEWTLKDIDRLKFVSVDTSCNSGDRISIEFQDAYNKSLHFYLDKGQESIIDVSAFKNIPSKLVIEKVKDSGCDAIVISYIN
jgi:hypothetical protein